VLRHAAPDAINIIDAAPGTSCPVIASIRNADYVALVTEPTPFGLGDLKLALSMVRELHVAHGVIINKAEQGNDDAEKFCAEHKATIIARIPDNRRIAEAYSRGDMLITALPETGDFFQKMWRAIRKQAIA
jgi:MinD superfamily P-loop ATPase